MPSRSKQTKQAGIGKKDSNPPRPYSYLMPPSSFSLPQDKGTKMPMMPPGSQTGVYYMPIGNLPWNVTWQDLKDFTRDPRDGQGPCDVEHAEVYRTGKHSRRGGYGYIKVRGEANFWRIYNYLNGLEWNGRCLQPDCRNATQPVSLSYVQLGLLSGEDQNHRRGSSSSSSRRPSTSGESVSSQDSNWSSSTAMTQNSGDTNWYRGTYYDPNTAVQTTQQYTYQPGLNQVYPQYNPPSTESMTNYAMTPTNVAFMPIPENAPYPYMNTMPQQTVGGYQVNYSPSVSSPNGTVDQQLVNCMSGLTIQPNGAADQQLANYMSGSSLQANQQRIPLIETEARKIIIRHLPHQVEAEEIRKLIARYSTYPPGIDKDAVEELDLPTTGYQDSIRRRGHAFAVLKDSAMARRCIESLHGFNFGGRELDVRLAKEGVSSVPRRLVTDMGAGRGTGGGSSSSSSSRHGERKSGNERGSRSGKSSGVHQGSSSSRDSRKIYTSAVPGTDVVPNRSKGSQTPIVVNGSSPPQ